MLRVERQLPVESKTIDNMLMLKIYCETSCILSGTQQNIILDGVGVHVLEYVPTMHV